MSNEIKKEKENIKKYKIDSQILTEQEFLNLKKASKNKFLFQFVKRETDGTEVYSKKKIFLD